MTINLHPENVDLSDYYDAEFVLTRFDLPTSEPDERSAVGRLVLYRGDLAVVRMWEPLGCSLCDALLSFLDGESAYPGDKCWVGISDCRPTDGLGPLPDRNAVCRRAAEEHRLFLERQLADHVRKHLGGERFVAINCAAIPDNLLESELFGYERGAFTGAAKTTSGKIEMAHRGTLMLDEIGDLPYPLQAKLLRFLQERVIERVGGRQEIPVDVRVVCATHQDLTTLISEGKFREDLYYRLAEIVIDIPPLRDRSGDAALLAHALVKRFSAEQNRGTMTLAEDAVRAIERHRWAGNVRELENCIKRAVIMAGSCGTWKKVSVGSWRWVTSGTQTYRRPPGASRRRIAWRTATGSARCSRTCEMMMRSYAFSTGVARYSSTVP
jgi:hypothetical protein